MADAAPTTNVVPIRPRPAPETQGDLGHLTRSTESVLTLGLLSALSVGSKRDRRLFSAVAWEIGRLSAKRPEDPYIAEAADVLVRIRRVNHGR